MGREVWVNGRNNNMSNEKSKNVDSREVSGRTVSELSLGKFYLPNTSYAQVVKKTNQKCGNQHIKKNDLEECWKRIRYNAYEQDFKWAKKGFVGRVHNIDEVSMLQQNFMDIGIPQL